MILDKFIKDLGKGNKNVNKLIEEIVTDYFTKEKITEESLRVLKQQVTKAVDDYRRDNKSGIHRLIQKKATSLPSPSRIFQQPTTTLVQIRPQLRGSSPKMKMIRRVKNPANLTLDNQAEVAPPQRLGTSLLIQLDGIQVCLSSRGRRR